MWHDSFTCVPWLTPTSDITLAATSTSSTWGHLSFSIWHVPFKCVTWLVHVCAMTHLYAWHNTCSNKHIINKGPPSLLNVTRLVHMCDTTHSYVWHDSFTCIHRYVMGWLRLVGSIRWQVCFAKEPYKRDYILQKRPMIASILLTVANRTSAATSASSTHNYNVWHVSFTCVPWLIHTSDITHAAISASSNETMGWLRLVGSFKLQVSFAEYGSLLQGSFAKETYNFNNCAMTHSYQWHHTCSDQYIINTQL